MGGGVVYANEYDIKKESTGSSSNKWENLDTKIVYIVFVNFCAIVLKNFSK